MPESASPRHAAVVLAAGRSRRFGSPKPLLIVDGEPLVRRAVHAALATGPSRALVIVDVHATAIRTALEDLAGIEFVECGDDRMAGSLRTGLLALDDRIDAALVVLTDQPGLTAAHLQRLVEAWRTRPTNAAASTYAGTRGVPAILPRSWFARLLGADAGDEGARALLRAAATDIHDVEAPDLAFDIDTPQDFQRWLEWRTRRHEPGGSH
jgi:molybdenum cofactor cytidylyltransferase